MIRQRRSSRNQRPIKTSPPFKARLLLELLEARNLLSFTNVLVNNTAEDGTQFTQSETAIVAVPSTTPSTIVVGFNDSEENIGGTNHFTGFAQSTNQTSFTDKGALPASSSGDAGDPVLARDTTNGNIYYSTLPFSGNGIQVFKSTDNGNSFAAPTKAGSTVTGPDKDWITVDNAAGSGQGNVYVTFTHFGLTTNIEFVKSTTHASTWGKPISIASGSVQGSNVVVGTDHSIYVFWLNGSGSSQSIMVKKSTNQGKSFGSAITVTSIKATGVNGDLGLTNSAGTVFRTNTFPQAAVNPVNGNIYVVYDDKGSAAGDKADAFFTESTNGGTSWTTPVKLNDDTTTTDQWFPSIAVTPDGNHVGVFWYDRRNDPANNLIDRFGTTGTVSGSTVTFGANFQVTTSSFAPVFGTDPSVVSNYMGDYDQAAADNTNFYTSWGDNHLSTAPDVMFAAVPVGTVRPAALVVAPDPGTALATPPDAGGTGGTSLAPLNEAPDLNAGGLPAGSLTGQLPAPPVPAATEPPPVDTAHTDQFFAAISSNNGGSALATPSPTQTSGAADQYVPLSNLSGVTDDSSLPL
jgi:hypothetical protein